MGKAVSIIREFLNIDFPEEVVLKYNQDEQRRIKLVNYISIITILNMMFYVGIYSVLDFQLFTLAIIFLSISSLFIFGIIIINKRGYYNTAKILLATFSPLSMTLMAVYFFDKGPEFHVYLLLATIVPVFMWSFKQKGYLIVFILTYIFLYLIIEFQPPFFEPQITFPSNLAIGFKHTNIIICFSSVGAAIGFYQWDINRKEKQLIKQAEELKVSQTHKDIVYSIIAHDLKGPIGSIVGLTEFFLNDKSENKDRLRTFVGQMNITSNSLQKLLENLLDWSKMQSGHLEQNKSDFNIRETVEDAIQLYRELADKKEQSIKLDIDLNLMGNADRYMISTVLRNLISNAIKFTPNKGTILVSAKTNQNEIEICVSDSGAGMTEVDIENLFDFQKPITNPVKSKDKGSGLGLLICKDFIESNNGKIWVESILGEGSKFFFTLKSTDHSS